MLNCDLHVGAVRNLFMNISSIPTLYSSTVIKGTNIMDRSVKLEIIL